jgi:glycerol uptake facilitator-like aquaporin
MSEPSLVQKLGAELLGSAALLAVVVGSGIMAVNLAGGNSAIALLANAAATAGALFVLITLAGPISGAHFNPLVSFVARLRGELRTHEFLSYVGAQCVGAILGVILAHAMFELPLVQPGIRMRTGAAQWLSEGVASFGLLLTILLAVRQASAQIPALVASYVFAAYWFTASTAFGNPAVTLARGLTQTFAGIRPIDVPGFVAAQCAGALLALLVFRWLGPRDERQGRNEFVCVGTVR